MGTPVDRAFEGLRAAERAAAEGAWDAMARALPGWGEALVALRGRAGDRLVCADLRGRSLDEVLLDPVGALLRWTPEDLGPARAELERLAAPGGQLGSGAGRRVLDVLFDAAQELQGVRVLAAMREAVRVARLWVAPEPSGALRDAADAKPVAMRFVLDGVGVRVVVASSAEGLVLRAVASHEGDGVAGVVIRWEARTASGMRAVEAVTDDAGVVAGLDVPAGLAAQMRLVVVAGEASAELRWASGGA